MANAVSHFRGHLFADLRGSTAYTERAGNAAGAELVRRFRQLVRDEVSQHDGAEVKTEGDAIYVVFPSASTAVMCGLAIIDKAEEIAASEPEMPMHIGVGVHAGEAVAVPEGGYIGTAVNLAARVCAAAGPGELLVTGTVRGIAQASIPVTFVSRGKRKLKGIAEPVDLYVVVRHGAAIRRFRGARGRRGILTLATAGVVVLALLAVGAALLSRPATPTITPTPAPPAPVAARVGPLEIGQYVLTQFQPRFDFSIVDNGWSFTDESDTRAALLYEPAPGGTLTAGYINTVYTDLCAGGGESLEQVNTSEDLLDALRAQPDFIRLSDPDPFFVGDLKGLIIDVNIDPGVLAACSGPDVFVFPIGGSNFSVTPGELFRIYSLDVGDSNVSFVAKSGAGPDTPVPVLETFFGVARRLVDTVKF